MILTETQKLFMRLHKYHVIAKWEEVLGGGSLRATCTKGISVTIGHHEVLPLAERSLIRRGSGNSVYLTPQGETHV
jgi:hypothetical protein